MTRPVKATVIFSQNATWLKINQHTISRGSYGVTYSTHALDHVCRSSTYRNSSGRSNLPPCFNKRLQAMAIIYGLDPRRVSSHSLRIGGATAMSATGMSKYEIQQMDGGNTTQLFERARRALAKRTFAIQSTRRLNPGCTNQGRTKQ